MNKQELYDRINQLPSVLGWQGHGAKLMVAKNSVLELVWQLDKPQKVVVPKFVAEWIEEAREKHLSLHQSMDYFPRTEKVDGYLRNRDNQELFVRAWLDGYVVEREKLYTVAIPNPHMGDKCVVVLMRTWLNTVVMQPDIGEDWRNEQAFQLTEAEIRKDFDWAWQAGFAKEVG